MRMRVIEIRLDMYSFVLYFVEGLGVFLLVLLVFVFDGLVDFF